MQVLEDQELKSQPEPLVVKVRISPRALGPLRSVLEKYGGGGWAAVEHVLGVWMVPLIPA